MTARGMERGRRGLAAITTLGLVFAVLLVGPWASASHINPTGPVGDSCVEFQVDAVGTKSPTNFPDVDITLDSWDPDDIGFTFTVTGLTGGEFIDISVKSGQDIEELGPYGNGTHKVDTDSVHANSHVRLCVFEGEPPVTTEVPPTTELPPTTEVPPTTELPPTTVPPTTELPPTTVSPPTTTPPTATTIDPTTTTTTIPDEVLPTVITSTTPPVEVSPTDQLPFTGANSGTGAVWAVGLMVVGLIALALSRRVEER